MNEPRSTTCVQQSDRGISLKTHELASVLRGISDALNQMPDTEITSLPEMLKNASINQVPPSLPLVEKKKLSPRAAASIDEVHERLMALTKKEIVALIGEADIPVEIRSKDAAKDAARKIRTYLTTNPSSTRKVKSVLIRKHPSRVSEPLSKALGILLGDKDEVSATGS